jgi:sarcosine oxidase, subunit beta
LAPYLAADAIGGGFCAMEGKANPLRATPAIAAAAERAGARILRHTPVTGIEAVPGGYLLQTGAGPLTAARVVNAAGAAAGKVARCWA